MHDTTKIDELLRSIVEKGASDLHLQPGSPPIYRINGQLVAPEQEPISQEVIDDYLWGLITDEEKRGLQDSRHHVEVSYPLAGVARFRINMYKQLCGLGAAVRVIPWQVPNLDDLYLPPILKEFAVRPNGLVLVTGPAGCGKSTTLAAVVNYVNTTRRGHIITIEDPIEFVHTNHLSVITQRELGQHTSSFAGALKVALRGDPDVIVVGEMRDLDTIANAITAAETGHLVFATLHTNDAVQTIDRLIDVFPAHKQAQIRTQLAASLQGVLYQTLVQKKDGSGRRVACEVMVVNHAIRNLIKEDKTHQVYNVLQTSKEEGMHLLNDSLKELCTKGVITTQEALSKSRDPKALEKALHKKVKF